MPIRLVPLDYDGATVPSPAVDFNFEVTTYRFSDPGEHTIRWRLGSPESNVLRIRVAKPADRR